MAVMGIADFRRFGGRYHCGVSIDCFWRIVMNTKIEVDWSNVSLGRKIAVVRKFRGLTKTELANACGVTIWVVCKWEKDESEPRYFNFLCIADTLRVSLDWLAGRDESQWEDLT
jgi:DNA-binding XRE family transcriptional regulator